MAETVRVEKPVACETAETAFAFVLNVDNYAKLMPNVNRVQVLRQHNGQRVTHWDTEIEGAPLIWTENDLILPDRLRIDFDSIEGDFDVFRGCWEVLRANGSGEVHVACELEYSIGIPVIEEIVGPVLKEKIIENVETMLLGLVKGIDG